MALEVAMVVQEVTLTLSSGEGYLRVLKARPQGQSWRKTGMGGAPENSVVDGRGAWVRRRAREGAW
jgi:hypothetical protein